MEKKLTKKQAETAAKKFEKLFANVDEIGQGSVALWAPVAQARLDTAVTTVLSKAGNLYLMYENKFLHTDSSIYEMLEAKLLDVDTEYMATLILLEPVELELDQVLEDYSDNPKAVANWKSARTKGTMRVKVIDIIVE